MSGVTVVFDITGAIKTALAATSIICDIDTTSGPVAGDRDPQEWVQVGRVRVTRTPRTMSGQKLGGADEDGSVPLLVMVSKDDIGESAITTERARMKVLVGRIEAALALDPTLGGIVLWAYISAIAEQDQGIEPAPDASHWMTAEVTVTFKARIHPGEAT